MRFSWLALSLALVTTVWAQDKRIVGYYPGWGTYRSFQVRDIRADRLDFINYAFARISPGFQLEVMDANADLNRAFSPEVPGLGFRGNFNQLVLLKQRFPHVRTLISVAENASEFAAMASTASRRQTFSQSVVNFLRQYRFDGVDIDWEFPLLADRQNFTLLVQQLRNDLNAASLVDGRRYFLTAAISGGAPNYANLEIPQISEALDWINVMNYDYAGPWSSLTLHVAPLYGRTGPTSTDVWTTHNAITRLLDLGAPADKILMGVPFYGYAWRNISPTNNGLRQPAGTMATGTLAQGVYLYKDIVPLIASQPTLYRRFWDSNMISPWVYASSLENGLFITYNDVPTISAKAQYVQDRHLGGMMIWELSGDAPSGPNSMLDEMDRLVVPWVLPQSFSVTIGSVLQGNLASLQKPDGQEFRFVSNLPLSRAMPNYDIRFDRVVRLPSANSLTVRIDARAFQLAGVLRAEFFQWSSQTWVNLGSTSLSQTTSSTSFSLVNPSQVIEPSTANVRLRLTFRQEGPRTRNSYLALDHLSFSVGR
ncbi:MAG: glycoside hydrolase family 18 protein [Fimbriimonadaceae bacterium]|jgi:GH18 family chitinase|nr:glycoside hydrolase family 18 protein [Fimbriimonadaceae bacterium]